MKVVCFLKDFNDYKRGQLKSLEDYMADYLIQNKMAKDVSKRTNNSFDSDIIATKQINSTNTK